MPGQAITGLAGGTDGGALAGATLGTIVPAIGTGTGAAAGATINVVTVANAVFIINFGDQMPNTH